MHRPFDSLPEHSRVWVYQANRAFTPAEKLDLEKGLTALCEDWSAHGTPLHTSFRIQYDQFLILAVDETQNGASGCSIDGSVRYLKSLQHPGLDFFDRSRVAFLKGTDVQLHPLSEVRTLLDKKVLSPATVTFNNQVMTKGELERSWKTPVSESWLANYLPKGTVAQ